VTKLEEPQMEQYLIKQELADRAHRYILEGNYYHFQGKFDLAVNSYNKALEIDPDNADAWFNKGMSLKKIGSDEESAKCIETSIGLYCGR
jgi:tetratricopeptide (TPR) repeat protein